MFYLNTFVESDRPSVLGARLPVARAPVARESARRGVHAAWDSLPEKTYLTGW